MRPSLLTSLDALDRRISRRLFADPATGRHAVWLAATHRISQTGSYGIGWVALFAVVVTVLEGWQLAALAAACVLGTLLVNTGIKLLVRRPRPRYDNPVGERPRTFSMPSAHTSMAVVGASSMTLVAPKATVLWCAWAVVLAASRIVLGMHYVGDVVCGVLLGLALGLLVAVPLLQQAGASG